MYGGDGLISASSSHPNKDSMLNCTSFRGGTMKNAPNQWPLTRNMSDKTPENNKKNSPQKGKRKNKPGQDPRKPTWGILFWVSLAVLLFLVLPASENQLNENEIKPTLKDLRFDLEHKNVERVFLTNEGVTWKLAPDGLPADVNPSRTAVLLTAEIPESLVGLIDEKTTKGLEHLPPSKWAMILMAWGPWLVFMLIFYFVFIRQMRGGGGGGLFSFGKSKARLVSPDLINKTFKDVAGVDEAKEELSEIVDFLKDPAKFTKLGGRLPRGVLLNGPPGTGKTLLAKAIAGEAGVPFYSISGSDFVEMFVGVGASRVRDLFHQAKENSPSIIFLDEIDAVGRKRGSGMGGGHDEREQTLNAILVEMDGFESDGGVIVVASTNRIDVLDPALLRPGRFDRHVSVGLPDIEGRKAIVEVHSRKIKMAEDANLDVIAQGTPGFSGAELENLLNEAALIAVANDKSAVGMDDMEAARDKVAFGKEKKSTVIHADDLKNTAYHECGHALVSLMLPKATPLHKLTIIPRGNALGAAFYFPDRDEMSLTKRQLLTKISIAYGGRIAEDIFFGDVTTGASNDIQQATNIARKMVSEWGMSDNMGMLNYEPGEDRMFLGGEITKSNAYSEDTAKMLDKEVRQIMEFCYAEARKVIEENKDMMVRIAEKLLIYETLSGAEVKTLMAGGEMDRKPPVNPVIKTTEQKEEEDKERARVMAEEATKVSTEAPEASSEPMAGAEVSEINSEPEVVEPAESVKEIDKNKSVDTEA
jgi:cell division protease FtsH